MARATTRRLSSTALRPIHSRQRGVGATQNLQPVSVRMKRLRLSVGLSNLREGTLVINLALLLRGSKTSSAD